MGGPEASRSQRDGDSLEPVGEPMAGHTATVGVFEKALAFFGDHYLVSMGQDQTLRLWNVENENPDRRSTHNRPAAAFAVQPAQWLVATGTDDEFLLWNYNPDD